MKVFLFIFLGLLSSITFAQNDSSNHKHDKLSDSIDNSQVHTDTIEVNSLYFKKDIHANTGFINADYEEIKKTPGAADDVIRYFESSPGVSIGSDMSNEYIVRGGAPIENMIAIDNIELPNPNHFGPPGTNNGALSYINIQMVNETNFYTGGFPVLFGDKLSSVLDIKFKNGNEKKNRQSLDLSVGGLGISADGPIFKNLTYALSVRRSYFELFKAQFRDYPIPNYWDINLKLNYKLSDKKSISFTSLSAFDNTDNPDNTSPDQRKKIKITLLTNGINYENRSGKISYILTGYDNISIDKIDYKESLIAYNNALMYLDSRDNELGFKAHFIYNINKNVTSDFITGAKYDYSKDTLFTSSWINESDCYSPKEIFNKSIGIVKSFAGINFNFKLFKESLLFNTGLRTDYNSYLIHNFTASPRIGLTYKFDNKTLVNASAGIYFQSPEIIWLLADDANKDLLNLKLYNYVAGIEHYLFPNLRINLEAYYKQYKNYPIDLYNPIYIYINSGMDILPSFIHRAASVGNGYYTGLDLGIQLKNPGKGFYGNLNISLSRSGFAAIEGGILPGEFDYGIQGLLIAGYQIPNDWSFGLRVKYAGPRPTFSFDSLNSVLTGTMYYDTKNYLKEKIPYYMRVDVRIDKMFKWGNLDFSIYAEIENLLNKNNIYIYMWDEDNNRQVPFYQWSILPVLGFNLKF